MRPNQVIFPLILITLLADFIQDAVGQKFSDHLHLGPFFLNIGLLSSLPFFKDTSLLPPECVRGNDAKTRKCGRKGGILERIKKQPYSLFHLSYVVMSNAYGTKWMSCGPALSGSRTTGNLALSALQRGWLAAADPDSATELEGFTLVRMDRNQNSQRWRCVCVSIISAVILLTLQ